jgi:uncharacterized membrane protein
MSRLELWLVIWLVTVAAHGALTLIAWKVCNWNWSYNGVDYRRFDGLWLGLFWIVILPMALWVRYRRQREHRATTKDWLAVKEHRRSARRVHR